ncbi:uncharacterized protein LOC143220151 [Lasioglossum baleicum]|uniref:uncharacterized protein LOC143220151 n=1 Tax=Lasioglossum baleicum TaxID=434251 RepID=UPI003FCCA9EC
MPPFMVWRDTACNTIPTPLHQGVGHVRFRWGDVVVVGCYVSPNRTLAADKDCKDSVLRAVNQLLSGPVLVLGDFNAHATAWGCRRTNARGEAFLEWAAGLDLRILNRGGASTCVRPAGETVVDISFPSTAALKRLTAWGVEEKIELLIDHIPILMRYRAPGPARRRREEVSVLQRAVTEACDVAMPRETKKSPTSVYLWSDELTTLRERANRTLRRYTRARRGRAATSEEESALHRECRRTNKSLRRAIKKARSSEWKALLETLHRDPWGRPYRVVLGRVRGWSPPLTGSMEPAVAKRVFIALFPATPWEQRTAEEDPTTRCDVEWTDDRGVTSEELSQAIGEMGARSKAPGLDGIPGRAWVLASSVLEGRIRTLFTQCVREYKFPECCKRAEEVLLPEVGKS